MVLLNMNVVINAIFPTPCSDDEEFLNVKKKYEFVCEDPKPKKKCVETWLAEQAVKVLEEEKKMMPAQGNAKSRLNLFLQSQNGDSKPKYEVKWNQAGFTGCLCFYTVDVYENWSPRQSNKEETTTSTTVSSLSGMELL